LIDDLGCLCEGSLYLGLSSNKGVLLSLLFSLLLLTRVDGLLQGSFEVLGEIDLGQLQRLDSSKALLQHDLLKLLRHVNLHRSDVVEELASLELSGSIGESVDSESNARTLVVIAVLLVQGDEILLIQLVLELSPKRDLEPIVGSSIDLPSVSLRRITEVEGLHGTRVFNELVHESDVVPA